MKRSLLLVTIIVIALGFGLMIRKPAENQMSYINPYVMIFGRPKAEVNLDNVIHVMSSHSILGTPQSITPINEGYDRVEFDINEVYYGELIW